MNRFSIKTRLFHLLAVRPAVLPGPAVSGARTTL